MSTDEHFEDWSTRIVHKIEGNVLYVGIDPKYAPDPKAYVSAYSSIEMELMTHWRNKKIKTIVLDVEVIPARYEINRNDWKATVENFIGTFAAMPHPKEFVFVKNGDKYFGQSLNRKFVYKDKNTTSFREWYDRRWDRSYEECAKSEQHDFDVDFNRKKPLVLFCLQNPDQGE